MKIVMTISPLENVPVQQVRTESNRDNIGTRDLAPQETIP